MLSGIDDVRIRELRPVLSPAVLMDEVQPSAAGQETVATTRQQISEILHGRADKLLVVVGPCSVHDPNAALEYAQRLADFRAQVDDQLLLVMRTYFEKPRTVVGWKGLINDPDLDGSCKINHGLRIARTLLRDISELGIPAGTEFLDPISPQFVADLVSWGAIGARTTESQVHRQFASGLSMPVGFKNGTGGAIKLAADAVNAAGHAHSFLGVTKQGTCAIVETQGNPDCHVILRGGSAATNYQAEHVKEATEMLTKAGLEPRLMVDCSHGNSRKNHENQPGIARDLAGQLRSESSGIFGVMVESFLVAGRQDLRLDHPMTFGQSVTDACIDWETTKEVLLELADAIETRRSKAHNA
ncbi:MAG: 3-deoxy-7-phosphoheptulonate synthase [Myxococcota bacterium]